jgi:hypothetical protein
MPECQYYDFNMVGYMRTSSGSDLTNYTNVYLNYSVWYETEDYYDYIAILYSPDGQSWDMMDFLCGVSGGWVDYSFPLPLQDYVFLSFVFYSFTASTIEEGVYLDDISITGDPLPQPNLTYGTPSGWSGPIVPSSVQFTHTVNTLYTNQPTYIDFAVRNIAASTTETFFTDLYVDAVWINWFYTYGLASGAWSLVDDVSHTVSTPGEHTLRIEIDPVDWVEEENELDNIFIDTFTWINPVNLPNLTYTTPSGWSGPIVPSDKQETHWVGQLYSNQPTYIDWAIKNTGTASAGPFFTRLLVDGGSVQSWYIPSLAAGDTKTQEDFQYTLDAGNHTLRLEIDFYNDVAESNENDNIYSQTFYWNPAEITAEGEVWFQQLFGMPYTYWYWAVGFRVELWDADASGSGQLLASGFTNDWGQFTLGPVSNVEEDGTRQDIYVRVYAENTAAKVGDSITPQFVVVPFYIPTDTVYSVLSGTHSWMFPYNPSIEADTAESGFFYIGHVIRESYNYWLTLGPSPGQTQVLLRNFLPQPGYSYIQDILMIENADIPGTWHRDTFDKDYILHEFAHKIQFSSSFLDDTTSGTHTITTIISPGFAAREGFAEFWAVVSGTDSYFKNSHNSFRDTAWVNYENVVWGDSGISQDAIKGTANTLGHANEGAVAGILWDIYDDTDDDYSDSSDWGDTTLTHHHNTDGIMDSLSDGIDNILSVLLDRDVSGHHPDNIDEFWQAWFTYPSLGHGQAMQDIWYEHGEIMHCCNTDGIRGDANGSGSLNVADVAYLSAYLKQKPPGSPPPPCLEEGDVNGSGVINTADVTYLSAYLKQKPPGSPPPPACP